MNLYEFSAQIESLRSLVNAAMQQRTESEPLSYQEQLTTTFERLYTSLEELKVAESELHQQNSELRQQNEELRSAHQVLEAERQRFYELFEFSPEAYLLTDTNGIVTAINIAATDLLNISQQFPLGKPLAIYVIEEEHEVFHSKLTDLCSGVGVQEAWEMCLRLPTNRTPITVSVEVAAVLGWQGESIRLRWRLREITDRTRAEVALQESETRLQAILDNSPAAIYIKDIQGRFLTINRQWERILRLSREQIIGKTDRDIFPEEVALRLWANDQEVLATQTTLQREENVFLEDGMHTSITLKFPLFDIGVPYAVCSISTDITERKAAEAALLLLNAELEHRFREQTVELQEAVEALQVEMQERTQVEVTLRQSEARFRAIFERAGIGIGLIDLEGRVLDTNPALQAMLGYSREETCGKGLASYSYLEDMALDLKLFKELQAGEHNHYQMEKRYFHKDGWLVWGHLTVSLVQDSDAKPQFVFGMVQDITSRKLTEEALRESEERFRQLAENIEQVFWMKSVDIGRMLYVSPAYEKLWGRSCKEIYEQPNSWINAVHPEDRDRVTAAWEQQRAGEFDEEYRIVRPDHTVRWIHDRAFPIRDESGQIYRIAGIAQDITERKWTEAAMLESEQAARFQVEELEKLSQLKDDFLNTVSHELRTPVSNMRMSIRMLEIALNQQNVLNEEQSNVARYLQILRFECEREIGLINDLLDLQRLEAGSGSMNLEIIPLQTWLPQLMESFQERALAQQMFLQVDLDPELPPLMSDNSSLGRILTELINNACKYTPSGERIMVTASTNSESIQFQVSNSGVEIPQSELLRIFDKFYRIRSNDPSQRGTGLGLALVKKLAEHLGGTLQVKSGSGQTVFTVNLPMTP